MDPHSVFDFCENTESVNCVPSKSNLASSIFRAFRIICERILEHSDCPSCISEPKSYYETPCTLPRILGRMTPRHSKVLSFYSALSGERIACHGRNLASDVEFISTSAGVSRSRDLPVMALFTASCFSSPTLRKSRIRPWPAA